MSDGHVVFLNGAPSVGKSSLPRSDAGCVAAALMPVTKAAGSKVQRLGAYALCTQQGQILLSRFSPPDCRWGRNKPRPRAGTLALRLDDSPGAWAPDEPAIWAGFGRQDSGLKPLTFVPSHVRLPGRRPFHRLRRCPACWRTVECTANGRFASLRNAAEDE